MDLQDAFLQLALLGANWVLWILVALSIASVTVVIERWLYFRSIAERDTAMLKPLALKLADDDLEGAAALVKSGTAPGERMIAAMLEVASRGSNSAKAVMEGNRMAEKMRLERNLGFLGTVGSNAPFIGLFGTVLGIIRAFKDLSSNMAEASGAVMGGIAEALIATAVGLLVAIPAVIAFNYLKGRVKDIADDGNLLCATLLASLKSGDAWSAARAAE
jgi:biopolymer transport protein ExbB/TolQ